MITIWNPKETWELFRQGDAKHASAKARFESQRLAKVQKGTRPAQQNCSPAQSDSCSFLAHGAPWRAEGHSSTEAHTGRSPHREPQGGGTGQWGHCRGLGEPRGAHPRRPWEEKDGTEAGPQRVDGQTRSITVLGLKRTHTPADRAAAWV